MKYHSHILRRAGFTFASLAACASVAARDTPDDWREQKRLIDLHQHISYTPEHLTRAVKIIDRAGVGIAVNLSGGTVTRKGAEPSAFERNKALADRLAPGRILHYMNLDYSGWDDPGFSAQAAEQIEEGFRLGAAGLKQFKALGLYLRDRNGALLRIDDPKLDAMWAKCGELRLPVSIHVADPRAFWLPYAPSNERWTELQDHRDWWFGDPNIYPKREDMLAALNRVIARHPETTFVCVHFANNAEDLEWVDANLDKYPNMYGQRKEGWTSMDWNEGNDLRMDITKPLPFPDNSVESIYSSHTFEHFSYPHPMTDVLQECLRVLMPGGRLGICVPDASIYLKGYASNGGFDTAEWCVVKSALHGLSNIDCVNYMAYMNGEHRHMFDSENLVMVLRRGGFADAALRDFDPDLDMPQRRFESLYAGGTKPLA
ncbi:MAG: amidohydrolase family protein [Opitutaceae bacterium]